MNGEGYFRKTVGAMIAQGFAVDAVREALFLKGASEVWGGADMDAHPAWYFWLANSPGAYRLQLAHSRRTESPSGTVLRGVFSVKYYPSSLEPVFSHFSPTEQALIRGDWFDPTNTPRFEARVPENLFNIGTIELVRDLGCEQSFLAYTSLDQLRFRASARKSDCGDACRTSIDHTPVHVRQLPAWDLGYPLFDSVVGLHAFLIREPPKRVILSHQPGLDFLESQTGVCRPVESADTAYKSLWVAFFPESGEGTSPIETSVTAELLAPPWTPTVDTAAPWALRADAHRRGPRCRPSSVLGAGHDGCDCGGGHRPTPPGPSTSYRSVSAGHVVWELPLALNEQWWLMAETLPSRASLCGCH